MITIYWITRLDIINTLATIALVISAIATLLLIIAYYIANGQSIYDESHGYETSAKENRSYVNTSIKSLRYSIPILVISTVLTIFVPDTKDAMLIYGVGGTVDYLKQNPTAKQIPDKCINALDKWVDSWIEKDSIK